MNLGLQLENPMLNREAFDEWIDYRKRVKKKPVLTPEREEKRFCQWPLNVQRAAVDYSIDNGYQGIFFEKCAKDFRKKEKHEMGFIERHTDKTWREGL